jgi:hypothetical protein
MHHYPFSDPFSNVGGVGPTALFAPPPVHHPLQLEDMSKDYNHEQDYPSLFGKNMIQTGHLENNQNTAATSSGIFMFGATNETYLSESPLGPFPFFAAPAMFFEALPQQQPP